MDKSKENIAVAVKEEVRIAPLNQRFDFASYAQTRQFLDQLADLSKTEDYYPNVSFGKNYVNITIDSEGQAKLKESDSNFILDMQALAQNAAK